MTCPGIWRRALILVAAAAISGLMAEELRAQGYVAGKPEGSITLTPQDSSGGPPARSNRPVYRAPQPRSTITMQPSRPLPPRTTVQPRQPATARTPAWTPNWNSNPRPNNRNWTLGGDRWQPPRLGNNPAAGALGARQAINRIDAQLIRLVELRELARYKYQHGGGFRRDMNDFYAYQRAILRLQQQRNAIAQANLSDPRLRRQAQNNYNAMRGLNQQRFQGLRDAQWPVNQRATRRWLNNPNYRQ